MYKSFLIALWEFTRSGETQSDRDTQSVQYQQSEVSDKTQAWWFTKEDSVQSQRHERHVRGKKKLRGAIFFQVSTIILKEQKKIKAN